MNVRLVLFFVFSFVLLGAALGVVLHRNPVKSAMFLVVFFVGLASMYALLGAEFLAVVQVLVYVGAVMVLFLFVIMLIAVKEEYFESPASNLPRAVTVIALIFAFLLQFFAIMPLFSSQPLIPVRGYQGTFGPSGKIITGNVELLSVEFFARYLLPFELISIVLLVAVIGAVVLAKKNRRKLSE
ncbi:MAG: NADH-quinone oxidoreductase subunit J [Leptospiraceae bacterium]|nr:NADH-quinone oxidoreductase subunit J [Leptospiraceae bacterium]MDW8305663.1 NADH-quinone oxidoreductase subunit J [Leptospiraceae bacterium]